MQLDILAFKEAYQPKKTGSRNYLSIYDTTP